MKTEMMNNLLGATNVTPEREQYMEENLKTEETVEEKEYEMTRDEYKKEILKMITADSKVNKMQIMAIKKKLKTITMDEIDDMYHRFKEEGFGNILNKAKKMKQEEDEAKKAEKEKKSEK